MKETIAQMLKVEARAKEIVAAAETEAARVVRDARKEAAAIQDEAQRGAQAKAAGVIRQGAQRARERRDEELAEIDRKTESLRHVAQDKAGAAKKAILAALTGR